MKRGDNTRAIALDILMKYEKEGRKLRPLLLSVLEQNRQLEKRDRAFIKALVEGTVERLITLDWVMDRVSSTGSDRMKPVIRMIIRLGAYQLLFMDHVPDRAAVNEAAELVRIRHMDGLKPFVNGVLRAVARYRDEGIEYPDIRTEYSCPAWIAERFETEYGKERAEAMIRAGAGERPSYLRVNRRLTDARSLIRILEGEGVTADVTEYENTLRVSGGLIPSESQSFMEGLYSVQDISSQLAMYRLWEEISVYINETNTVDINLLDLCAAPGGKTCFAAELLEKRLEEEPGKDIHIKACDVSEQKLAKIRENLKRTGGSIVEPMINDASGFNPGFEEWADVIIADLPCSGLGVLGRKVDIKYRVKPGDIIELCNLQKAILNNAERYLKTGGILMFSVCTTTAEETLEQSEYIARLGLHKVDGRQLLQGIDPGDGC